MYPLTIRARHNAKRETLENYIIAACCGVIMACLMAAFI